jgi:hypothetical protein
LPALFERYISIGRDPYVTVDLDAQLTLQDAASAAKLLAAVDTIGGIRIESPPPGQLYYMALLPPQQFRDRANRRVQPWEYRLALTNGVVTGVLTLPQEVRATDGSGWTFKERTFDASTPETLKAALATRNDRGMPLGPPAIYVFAPPTMKYGEMLRLVGHAIDTHPNIFVYVTPEP